MKSNFRILFLFVLPLLLPAIIAAQTHLASVRGTVSDPTGALIPGATIRLRNLDTGETRTATTGEEGEYAITSIPPGRYEIEVEARGLAKRVRQLELLVNEQRRHDVNLSVGTLDPVEIDAPFEGLGSARDSARHIPPYAVAAGRYGGDDEGPRRSVEGNRRRRSGNESGSVQ